jgi:hypothetical protein
LGYRAPPRCVLRKSQLAGTRLSQNVSSARIRIKQIDRQQTFAKKKASVPEKREFYTTGVEKEQEKGYGKKDSTSSHIAWRKNDSALYRKKRELDVRLDLTKR